MKKFLLLLVILFSSLLYAREVTERTAEENNAWHEEFDISDKKTGKYNVMVTVTGLSGNESIAGPYNIYIDPNSDLPVIGITNPTSEIPVPGNLNIVGTCVDDDGVAAVQLILDDDRDHPITADGTEFWSYYLDTTELSEGLHTIEAVGIDINGLAGNSTFVTWNLNRNSPESLVTSHAVGTLLSKIVHLSGTVSDGNGIKSLAYSLDGGERFQDLKLLYDKKTNQTSFKLDIDTKKLPDGAAVIWFKSLDVFNTEGIYTWLFFVDNTSPDVSIVTPLETDTPNGVFSVAGIARDENGLKRLSWTLDNESGDFDLIPGNPYWCKEFDTTKTKQSSAKLSIIAEDAAGNIVTVLRNIRLNQEADKPIVYFQSPSPDTVAEKPNLTALRGFVEDDDGVYSVVYRFDNGPETEILTHGVFCTVLDADQRLSAGRHTVSAYAVDKYGVRGDTNSITFMAMGPEGSFSDAYIRMSGRENLPVTYGLQVDPSVRPTFESSVQADCGIQYISWTLTPKNGEPIKGERTFNSPVASAPVSIPLAQIPAGQADIEINAFDRYHRPLKQNSTIGIMNYSREAGASSVEISPEPEPEPIGDLEPPIISVQSPINENWVKSGITISGTAQDDGGIETIEYSLDAGVVWNPIEPHFTEGTNTAATYSVTVELHGSDGLIPLNIRVTDISGNVSVSYLALNKDTTPPEASIVLPLAEDVVNGTTLMVFDVKDNECILSGAYIPSDPNASRVNIPLASLTTVIVGGEECPIDEKMRFVFRDEIGNETYIDSIPFVIDAESDLPRVEIHLPADGALETTDFIVSGVIYDDDGPSTYFYKIDDGEWYANTDPDTSFSFTVPLSTLTDNEHTVTVYAVDINGVKGEEVVRPFRVSLEEPKGSVISPSFDETVHETITVQGTASDANGIEKVMISLDNGNSFSDATGTEEWSFTFDTHIVADGSHVLFYKIYDKYGIQAIYSNLINIDNTAPELSLTLPLDGSKSTGNVFFSGSTIDNIKMTELYLAVHTLDKESPNGGDFVRIDLEASRLISKTVDISEFDDGLYNFELFGKDSAGNETRISRNVQLDKTIPPAKVDILYPLTGSYLNGTFSIAASIKAEKEVDSLNLFVDGLIHSSTILTGAGYCQFVLNSENLTEGQHTYKVQARMRDGSTAESVNQVLTYSSTGPWVTIEGLSYGDFAINRPYLLGNAGYTISEEDKAKLHSKETYPEEKAAIEAKTLASIEISLDNGKSFAKLSSKKDWKYRIENDYLEEGFHFILVRAVMKNGEIATARTIVQIDKSSPDVRLVSPGEGGRFNQILVLDGLASDELGIQNVSLALRSGDKMMYEVPGFIQGLYFDVHVWGATLYDLGFGLSFFDDNVKLQFQVGQFTESQRSMFKQTPMRYGGNVMGAKILANVAYLPFQYFFGPDLSWLSANVAIGANFSRFDQTNSGKPQILSAMLTQIEFPRVTFEQRKRFRTLSFYTEVQLWFIPSDISNGGNVDVENLVPQIGWGVRMNVF